MVKYDKVVETVKDLKQKLMEQEAGETQEKAEKTRLIKRTRKERDNVLQLDCMRLLSEKKNKSWSTFSEFQEKYSSYHRSKFLDWVLWFRWDIQGKILYCLVTSPSNHDGRIMSNNPRVYTALKSAVTEIGNSYMFRLITKFNESKATGLENVQLGY